MASYAPTNRERYEALCAPDELPAPPSARARADLASVAEQLATTPVALAGRCRTHEAVARRQEAMWLLRRRGHPIRVVAQLLERDRATVVYGLEKVSGRLRREPGLRPRLEALAAMGVVARSGVAS